MYPEDDENEGGGTVAFLGSWSSYAGFRPGFIFVHTIERGSFVVKMGSKECEKRAAVCEPNARLTSLRASSVAGRLEESIGFCDRFLRGSRARYAREPCAAAVGGRKEGVVAQVSSARVCVPTVPVPELPRTTTGPPVPTVLPPKQR